MIYLIVALLAITGCACWWARSLTKTHVFAMRYAQRRAESLSVSDPRGQAYSDMADVLVLALDRDGRRHLTNEPLKWWEKVD